MKNFLEKAGKIRDNWAEDGGHGDGGDTSGHVLEVVSTGLTAESDRKREGRRTKSK